MNDHFLQSRLLRVARRFQWVALIRKLSALWAAAALVGVALVGIQRGMGWAMPLALPLLVSLAVGAALAIALLHFLQKPDLRWVAQKIEKKFPDLDGLLVTAVQQASASKDTAQSYLQYRVLQQATVRSQEQDWRATVPAVRFIAGLGIQAVALFCFAVAVAGLRVAPIHGEKPAWVGEDRLAVTPGDTSVEKGDSLTVLARFGGALPSAVSLVVRENGVAPRTIPLVKSLADPVFGGSVTEVSADFTYRLDYRGQSTREFKVTVYEHPKLIRSDVALTFPDYTKLPVKRIEDTRRVSAVEGTKLDFALQLNKPVKAAKLVSRDGKKTEIVLSVSPDKPVATLADHRPAKSGSYDLQLVDADGRANKTASPFVIDVQPNRPPEIRLSTPRGDVRPSPLEEVAFEGTVWDDFGTTAYGLAYAIGSAEPTFVELGRGVAAKEKQSFAHLLKLEALAAKPDDLISWYAWAEDIGPDGQPRRTSGDMYFAEVRPFDEIFRESQNMESAEPGEQGGGQGEQTRRLAELQKQIIGATWKLRRTGKTASYAEDAKVVADSQVQALAQATEAAAEALSPRGQAMWRAATAEMEKAVEHLKAAASDPAPLAKALPAEQAAYQALLKLNARETNITRRQRGGGGGGGQEANQRQIDQLDLEQSENRYETQRQARAPQNQERREQLAVTNRLQELARRQQDLNERLKELQTALQEAKTEQEREEVKRRLKRLQEEQQQMLADVDEVKQRMERPENQSRMADERQQLEQTREEVQKAAEAAADGSVAQALAAGTRAQRQLQEMRDEMRKENSSQFAEDLREMRGEARDLAQKQEAIGEQLEQLASAERQPRRSLSDTGERKELLDQLAGQKERMNRLVDRATQISEQAENTEPLLSRQLYDSLRKVTQDDGNAIKQTRQELLNRGMMTRDLYDRLEKAGEREEGGKALDLTGELLREGMLPQARQAGQSARAGIDELKRGVERAAESVLGDDAEQLRLAQSELDALTEQLQREIAQATGGQPGQRDPAQRDGRQAGNARGQQPGKQGTPGEPGEAQPGQTPGEGQGEGAQAGERGERERQVADAKSGQRRGKGQAGKQPGGQQPGEQPSQGAGEQPGQQSGEGQAQGEGQGQGQGQGESQQAGQASGQGGGESRMAGGERGGRAQQPGNGRRSIEDLMREGAEGSGVGGGGWDRVWDGRVLGGEDFGRWNERLRDVEELLETPDLRNAVATARERARLLSRELRDRKKPDWAQVQLQIVQPLVEVRSRVAEELARRDSKDSLAPIDRDPVPNRFAESVRRYYEELGKDN